MVNRSFDQMNINHLARTEIKNPIIQTSKGSSTVINVTETFPSKSNLHNQQRRSQQQSRNDRANELESGRKSTIDKLKFWSRSFKSHQNRFDQCSHPSEEQQTSNDVDDQHNQHKRHLRDQFKAQMLKKMTI